MVLNELKYHLFPVYLFPIIILSGCLDYGFVRDLYPRLFRTNKIFFLEIFETKIQKISLWLSCKKVFRNSFKSISIEKKFFFWKFRLLRNTLWHKCRCWKIFTSICTKVFFFSLKNKTKILTQKTVIISHAVYFNIKYYSSLQYRYDNLRNYDILIII